VSEGEGATVVGELFDRMAGFRIKRMFGGLGLFAGEVMFGLIDEGQIYLKTDAALEADLRAAGAQPWLYTERRGPRAGITVETSYLSLPDEAYDDPDEACRWAEKALAVAAAVRETRRPRGRKRGGTRRRPQFARHPIVAGRRRRWRPDAIGTGRRPSIRIHLRLLRQPRASGQPREDADTDS